MLVIFVVVILIVFLFDFAKMRGQNETLIVQNKKIIALLEEMKEQKKD
ncbi:hypothetical protein [Robertmurraya massiliosenegalensis]|nr:hypothetical protein [Robertmurraya massiliosenegalensis]